MLSYYTHQSSRAVVQRLTGVSRHWYLLVILPFVVFPLCLLLALCFTNRGPIMFAGLVLMIWFRTFHPHRLNDVSR